MCGELSEKYHLFLKTWNLKEKNYTTKNIIVLINKEDYYNENRNNQKRDN